MSPAIAQSAHTDKSADLLTETLKVVSDDGTMARVPDLVRFCDKHNVIMISVADVACYRMELE
jgi:3,4-dihydroxy-2-butanone 4-phosphate synthase